MITYHYNGKQIDLQLNGTDNPSCPNCARYNAMLFDRECNQPSNDYVLKCRDCSAEVVVVYRIAAPLTLEEEAISALVAIEPFLSNEEEFLNYAAMNDGQASSFDVASMRVRRVLGLWRCRLPILDRIDDTTMS